MAPSILLPQRGADFGQNVKAGAARQHDIQDHQIVVPLQAMVQTVHTVGDEVHGKAGLAQALSEVVTRFGLIFNDQNFHKLSITFSET